MPQTHHQSAYIRDIKRAASITSSDISENVQPQKAYTISQSRSGLLHIIDRIAHRSLRMLSMIIIVTMSLSAFYAFAIPQPDPALVARLLLWVGIILTATTYTTYQLVIFRRGYAYSGHPFRWRAHYTSSLAVLSFALGSGAIFLTPSTVSLIDAGIIYIVILVASLMLGFGHLAHQGAALAGALPGAAIAICTAILHILTLEGVALQQFLFLWAGCVILAALSFAWGKSTHARVIAKVLQEYPRHETMHVKGRRKRTLAGYNPYSFRASKLP